MKMFNRLFAWTVLAAAGTQVPAPAAVTEYFTVQIPFEFTAGRSTLPAGEYTIKSIGENTLLVRNAAQTSAVMIMTNSAMTQVAREKSMLVFHVYGRRHYLSSAWMRGDYWGREVPKSHSERETELAGVPRVLAYVSASAGR
jgi:hypothetical protein